MLGNEAENNSSFTTPSYSNHKYTKGIAIFSLHLLMFSKKHFARFVCSVNYFFISLVGSSMHQTVASVEVGSLLQIH